MFRSVTLFNYIKYTSLIGGAVSVIGFNIIPNESSININYGCIKCDSTKKWTLENNVLVPFTCGMFLTPGMILMLPGCILTRAITVNTRSPKTESSSIIEITNDK